MKKATHTSKVTQFEQIPNIGKKMAEDFRLLGLKSPSDLAKQDGFKLYERMCKLTGTRQDPCVLDTYLAAVHFMNGGKARPWFDFTAERKKKWPHI